MLFGYARVATAEQNPARQIEALLQAGVANNDIQLDHASGAQASRPPARPAAATPAGRDLLITDRVDGFLL